MKTAVSIPDDVFEEAERVARLLGLTRSALYARALEAFVAAYRRSEVREALDVVYGSEPSEPDPLIDELQAEALREEW